MSTIVNKVKNFKSQPDKFKLGSAIAVGVLLLLFVGATIYVLLSSSSS